MTNKTIEKQRATRMASKEDRDRDAATAMKEYEAEKAAVLVKTARLRAMRLAKEAGEQAAAEKPRPAAKKKSKR